MSANNMFSWRYKKNYLIPSHIWNFNYMYSLIFVKNMKEKKILSSAFDKIFSVSFF